MVQQTLRKTSSIGFPTHEQLSHSEAAVFIGGFFAAQPCETVVDAVEGVDDDAGGLSGEVELQEPDVTH